MPGLYNYKLDAISARHIQSIAAFASHAETLHPMYTTGQVSFLMYYCALVHLWILPAATQRQKVAEVSI